MEPSIVTQLPYVSSAHSYYRILTINPGFCTNPVYLMESRGRQLPLLSYFQESESGFSKHFVVRIRTLLVSPTKERGCESISAQGTF